MKHLIEDEMTELYYGEGAKEANAHVEACRECSRKYAEFKRSLEGIGEVVVPHRSADYGQRMWETLRPQLIPYEKKAAGWRGWMRWKAVTVAVSCTVLLAAAFLGGRYWERSSTKKANIAAGPQATQRVVLVVLGDHLDRSERLLVQLEHSRSPDRIQDEQLQVEARELLASNRLYRVSAGNSGDAELAEALDRLEGVLAEVANNPSLTAGDLKRLRTDMNTRGILFEIRVLQTRHQDQGTKGATI